MNKLYEPIINEKAYLSEDEERKIVSQAVATINDNHMTPEEANKFLENFPIPRLFAGAYRDILGEEEYIEFEKENAEIIRTRAWENAQ